LLIVFAASGRVREDIPLARHMRQIILDGNENLFELQAITLGQPKIKQDLILGIHLNNIDLEGQHHATLIRSDHSDLTLALIGHGDLEVIQGLLEQLFQLFGTVLDIHVDKHSGQSLDKFDQGCLTGRHDLRSELRAVL